MGRSEGEVGTPVTVTAESCTPPGEMGTATWVTAHT